MALELCATAFARLHIWYVSFRTYMLYRYCSIAFDVLIFWAAEPLHGRLCKFVSPVLSLTGITASLRTYSRYIVLHDYWYTTTRIRYVLVLVRILLFQCSMLLLVTVPHTRGETILLTSLQHATSTLGFGRTHTWCFERFCPCQKWSYALCGSAVCRDLFLGYLVEMQPRYVFAASKYQSANNATSMMVSLEAAACSYRSCNSSTPNN